MGTKPERLKLEVDLRPNGGGGVATRYALTVEYTPGDPGCRMTPNGDGWPPDAPDIDVLEGRDLDEDRDLGEAERQALAENDDLIDYLLDYDTVELDKTFDFN